MAVYVIIITLLAMAYIPFLLAETSTTRAAVVLGGMWGAAAGTLLYSVIVGVV